MKPLTKQVRKTISFSEKRDKELIKFIEENKDDFSYEAKQLMLDGLKFRQQTNEDDGNNEINEKEVYKKEEKDMHNNDDDEYSKEVGEELASNDFNPMSSLNDLMDIEVEKTDIDEKELEDRLDSF